MFVNVSARSFRQVRRSFAAADSAVTADAMFFWSPCSHRAGKIHILHKQRSCHDLRRTSAYASPFVVSKPHMELRFLEDRDPREDKRLKLADPNHAVSRPSPEF